MHPQPQSISVSSTPLASFTGGQCWMSQRCHAVAWGSSGSDSWTSSLLSDDKSFITIDKKGSAPPAVTTLDSYLLSEQLIINSDSIQGGDIFPQLQVALAKLLDVLACFGQDSSFTLKEENVGTGGWISTGHFWINLHTEAHLSRLGVIDVAVWDGLGQLHNPVVDLISAPTLNCRNKNIINHFFITRWQSISSWL